MGNGVKIRVFFNVWEKYFITEKQANGFCSELENFRSEESSRIANISAPSTLPASSGNRMPASLLLPLLSSGPSTSGFGCDVSTPANNQYQTEINSDPARMTSLSPRSILRFFPFPKSNAPHEIVYDKLSEKEESPLAFRTRRPSHVKIINIVPVFVRDVLGLKIFS